MNNVLDIAGKQEIRRIGNFHSNHFHLTQIQCTRLAEQNTFISKVAERQLMSGGHSIPRFYNLQCCLQLQSSGRFFFFQIAPKITNISQKFSLVLLSLRRNLFQFFNFLMIYLERKSSMLNILKT